MKNQRVVYFDYLRIIAIFSVVVLHVTTVNWDSGDVRSFSWQVHNFYDAIVRWGVPVFVMISGALFLGKPQPLQKLYGKNILRIVATFAVWSTLYAFWRQFITHNNPSLKGLVKEILLGHYHLWFLFMIVGLYIVVPFLNKIVENDKTAWYFVILSLVFAFVIPQCAQLIGLRFDGASNIINQLISKLDLHMVLGYTGYYVLGYMLNKTVIKKKHEIIIYLLGFVGLAFTVVVSTLLSVHSQTPVITIFSNMTPNVFLVSVAVFTFAKQHWNKPAASAFTQRTLPFLSQCTFGVYLIHPFFIEGLSKFANLSTTSFNPIISVPVLSVAVFAVSFLVSALFNRIPFVNKWFI